MIPLFSAASTFGTNPKHIAATHIHPVRIFESPRSAATSRYLVLSTQKTQSWFFPISLSRLCQ
jgi:hypothetical protein